MLRYFLATLALCLLPVSAQAAATCYWVVGTSYNTAANWSSSTGGSGSTCAATSGIPKNAGDTAKLDASSPASTTLTLDVDISILTLDMGALTGSSGFDASTHNITLSGGFVGNGTGTRTLTMGSGTWTMSDNTSFSLLTITGLTFNAGTATLVFNPGSTGITFYTGGETFNAITMNGNAAANISINSGDAHGLTVTTLSIGAGVTVQMQQSQAITVTNAFSFTGTAANPIFFTSGSASTPFTLHAGAASTCVWCVFKQVTGSTSAITATSSFNVGGSGGTLSISAPSGGGGGFIIGGG